jgi:hypothetical protein
MITAGGGRGKMAANPVSGQARNREASSLVSSKQWKILNNGSGFCIIPQKNSGTDRRIALASAASHPENDFLEAFPPMRHVSPFLSLVLLSLLSSCSAKLSQAEVEAANLAFARAQAVQADILAADSFAAARAANDALQANLNARDYGRTTPLAKALAEASSKAIADSAIGLEAAKAEVARLGADIAAELTVLQKIYAKAAASKAKLDLKTMKAALTDAPGSLAEALDRKFTDAVSARAQLLALKETLEGYRTSLETAGFKE